MIFHGNQNLAILQLGCDLPPMPIFFGMRVVITQNHDKLHGVVNEQLATIHMVQNQTVFLKSSNGKIVAIYPVTMKKDNKILTVYPFCAAYATTMCKA